VQFAITRVAVPRRGNGPDPEPPLRVHEHSHVDRDDVGVIVVEGGLGALAATLLLARRGHCVTRVERDADTPGEAPTGSSPVGPVPACLRHGILTTFWPDR
jgi:hypothetical protein